jgi:hypothetical protein
MVMFAVGPASDAERQHCGAHAKTADCRTGPGYMKVIFAPASAFLINPSGKGLPLLDLKTVKTKAAYDHWMTQPRIEFNHVA